MVRVREVVDVEDVDEALVADIGRLLPQLSSSAAPPTVASLAEIVSSPTTRLLVAVDDEEADPAGAGRIIGTLTLAVFSIPTGVRAWIEDVVTDELARGRGVGEALTARAVELAAGAGAKTLELTSRPSREAANRLYARLGFERRETNVYRLVLEPPAR